MKYRKSNNKVELNGIDSEFNTKLNANKYRMNM